MKNYLLAIDNEIQNYYEELSKDTLDKESRVSEFCKNITAVLDYYTEPIFNSGKIVVGKKLNVKIAKNNFNEYEAEFINNYKYAQLKEFESNLIEAINNCFNSEIDQKEFYEDIIELVVDKCIKLFKYAQLSEIKNNGIDKVSLFTNDESCIICKTKSQFNYNVDELIQDINNLHSFCKLTFEPDYDINKIINNLEKMVPNLITDKNFKIVSNIAQSQEFLDILKNKYDENKIETILEKVNNNIMSLQIDDVVYISKNHVKDFKYIVTQYMIKDKLEQFDLSWWNNEFENRQKTKYVGDNIAIYNQPFISYIAEQDVKSFFIESAVYYIINPSLLKTIDKDSYEQLKTQVFNNMEF